MGLLLQSLECVVLDLEQQRLCDMSPGDLESTFAKVGDSETKERLRVEEAKRESLGDGLLWLLRNIIGKK